MIKRGNIYKHFLVWRLRHIPDRTFILILSILIGIGSGIIALIFKTSVFHIESYLLSHFNFEFHHIIFLFLPIIGVSIAVFFKINIVKDHIKHNIASILHAISKRNSLMKIHKIYSSVVGAIFTAGFGGSVGLESPIISSGAALGSYAGRIFHLNYKSITLLLACGASGAIAAIFSTPIAAIVFALEVLLIDLTRFSLIPLLLSSTSGAITTKVLLEEDILFKFEIIQPFSNNDIFYIIILGLLSGLISLYFTRVFIIIENLFDKLKTHLNRLLIGAIALGVLIYIFPALYGEGYGTIKAIIEGNTQQIYENSYLVNFHENWGIIFLFFLSLVLFKVIATAITIGSGGVGGIFAPALFTGAILGYIYAFTLNNFVPDINLSEINYALIGMASVLGGVLNAPLTGIFLIAEITSGYELIVPLMLSTTITYVTVKKFEPNSIITYHLVKHGELITHNKDKAVLHFMQLKSVIEYDFISVNINGTLQNLIQAISKSKRNIFPVIDKENNFMGIILLDDIRDIMFQTELYKHIKIRKLAHMPTEHIDYNDSMEEVIKKFNRTGTWNLPVLEGSTYIGFVSKSKLFSTYRKHLMEITEE